jgi:hypothetical protein
MFSLLLGWLASCPRDVVRRPHFFFFFIPATPKITFFSQLPWRDSLYPYTRMTPLGIKSPFGTAITWFLGRSGQPNRAVMATKRA